MSIIGDPIFGEKTRQVGPTVAHHYIIQKADDAVQESYDILASDKKEGDKFFKRWPNKKEFCNRFRELFVQQVRKDILARLNDPNTPMDVKFWLFEIYKLDSAVPGADTRGIIEVENT